MVIGLLFKQVYCVFIVVPFISSFHYHACSCVSWFFVNNHCFFPRGNLLTALLIAYMLISSWCSKTSGILVVLYGSDTGFPYVAPYKWYVSKHYWYHPSIFKIKPLLLNFFGADVTLLLFRYMPLTARQATLVNMSPLNVILWSPERRHSKANYMLSLSLLSR